MSYTTKAQATAAARACRRKMKTKGWKLYVHENLGWHWCLEHADGFFTLHEFNHPGEKPKYWTLMSDGGHQHCGSGEWTPRNKMFLDPNRAVAYQLKLAKDYARNTLSWVNKVDWAINGKKA